MKRRMKRTERHAVYAELFREESVLVVVLVNFPTTRKELQILVGVNEDDRSAMWDHASFMSNLNINRDSLRPQGKN
ncbi:unnamed protein product [Eruca vesicaria subsp. sativa]|uniref:Uncharacterized protein n=1 Tax=Eruca vesicaria subsp. sativa TaxID=29727 RepID=A0ABC8JK42_ERUVS|nr:unnamed protein product [Eruca vesicaria subsp. sativa]